MVVSEETGTISVANEGKMKRGFDEQSLASELRSFLVSNASPVKAKFRFTRKNGKQKGDGASEGK